MRLKEFVGSGGKMWRLTTPFLIVGLALNSLKPSFFHVGGPSAILKLISIILLIAGVVMWWWSVALILTRLPKKELVTVGPYALVKHPIYTSVSLLVLPPAGLLLNSWLGAFVGIVLYITSRIYGPEEEKALSAAFGAKWEEYAKSVKIPWL